jgi:hypothetical protein
MHAMTSTGLQLPNLTSETFRSVHNPDMARSKVGHDQRDFKAAAKNTVSQTFGLKYSVHYSHHSKYSDNTIKSQIVRLSFPMTTAK